MRVFVQKCIVGCVCCEWFHVFQQLDAVRAPSSSNWMPLPPANPLFPCTGTLTVLGTNIVHLLSARSSSW